MSKRRLRQYTVSADTDFPERRTKNGFRMARVASGVDGPAGQVAAREAASAVLRKLGLDISRLARDDMIIDVGRRAGGGSFWIVWIKEDLLTGGGTNILRI